MQHDNSNRGTLNRTREKRSDRSPDYYGRLQISGEVLEALKAGKAIRLSGWTKRGQYGEFISLAAEVEKPRQVSSVAGEPSERSYNWAEAEARARAEVVPSASTNVQAALSADFDDAIPF